MFYTKQPHAANFSFATHFDAKKQALKIGKQSFDVSVRAYEGDIFHVQISNEDRWPHDYNIVGLHKPAMAKGESKLKIGSDFGLSLLNDAGEVILQSSPEKAFGVMAQAAMFCFEHTTETQYFGMGEKNFGTLELSGKRTKYWNTDALGDFPGEQWFNGAVDPYYVSVPYLIVRRGNDYVGLLYHNPCAPFMETGVDPSFMGNMAEERRIVLGSEDGMPSLWIIYGPTLAELTTKLQKLVGTTPLPPLWSLGYHQCKWGYKGEKDLVELDAKMTEHAIPNDGLWLDIDYMEGFRVFTYSQEHFPKGVASALKKVAKTKRKVCPIIDPGVKHDPGYSVYDSGLAANIFCLNPEGNPYIGIVWPGLTVFPDFSMPKGRTWWSEYAFQFKDQGFAGAWLDMNDPSTGAIDPNAMLFNKAKWPHIGFRNQYALGMQMATFDGFQKQAPNERIFLLSRSGYVGTSRYSAIWTGDSCSSRFYIKGGIPQAINLGLSGIPFCGNDIGGFFGDPVEHLFVDWAKAYFLMPFFRIHSGSGDKNQEPWAFSAKTLKTVRRYIRLRYKLLPFLYQLFITQEDEGHPMFRPLLYHYDEVTPTGDQFLVGEDILQAPLVDEERSRKVYLPGRQPWFDLSDGTWHKPGRFTVDEDGDATPIYARHGAILPALPGERTDNEKDLANVEFHIFLRKGTTSTVYQFDDGSTLNYLKGIRSAVRVTAVARGEQIEIATETISDAFGGLTAEYFIYGDFKTVTVNGRKVKPRKARQAWVGKPIPVLVVSE